MPPLPRPSHKLALAALFLALLSATGLAADTAQPPADEAVQMLADVTLIDGECRNAEVNFGRAFQVAQTMGLRAVDVVPTGAERVAFEAAARDRFERTSHDDLCGVVAKALADRIPGLLRLR